MKKGTTKKEKERKGQRKKRKNMSGEKSEREEKRNKCSTGQKNPLSEKGIKKRIIMDMCPRVSRTHFSKK
jgi:hypothetical protein